MYKDVTVISAIHNQYIKWHGQVILLCNMNGKCKKHEKCTGRIVRGTR